MCDGSGPPTWQATASVDTMATTIVFDSDVVVRETAITATLGHFARPSFGWSVTAGGIVAGSIEGRSVHGGGTLAGAVNWLVLYERERRPFVALTGSLGTALMRATADDGTTQTFSPWDLRAGAMVGKTLFDHVVPYAAARVFGGPVFWHHNGASVTGSDRYHVTAGVGVVVRLPDRLDVSVEGMPLGEQSLTGAITVRF
jgi:hypothetical protein